MVFVFFLLGAYTVVQGLEYVGTFSVPGGSRSVGYAPDFGF